MHNQNDSSTDLLGLDHTEEDFNVVENVFKDLLFGDSKMRIVVVGMGADMDDAVHVEVKVVEIRNLVFLDHFAQTWISLTEPSIEFWNSHFETLNFSASSFVQFCLPISRLAARVQACH